MIVLVSDLQLFWECYTDSFMYRERDTYIRIVTTEDTYPIMQAVWDEHVWCVHIYMSLLLG